MPARVPVKNESRVAVNLFLSCRGLERVKEGEVVDTFYRIEKDREVYHSKAYTRVSVRNSYTIKFKNSQNRDRLSYGQVISYFHIQECCIALVEHLVESIEKVLSPPAGPHQPPVAINTMLLENLGRLLDGHLPMATKVQCSNQTIAVDVHSIVRKCVLVNTGSDLFVSNIPNFVETD